MALYRAKRISKWLEELLSEQDSNGIPKNKRIAETLIQFALDEKKPDKTRLEALTMLMDRVEGKPINFNVNQDAAPNPFEGIDTTKLTELREKLEGKVLPPPEGKC